MKFVKKLLNCVLSFYNRYFGVIDGIIAFALFMNIDNKVIKFGFLALGIYSAIHWYKVYFKNLEYKNRVHSKVTGNSVLAIYGGIGTGKSTLARRLLNLFTPKDKQYFNFKCVGYKALTWRHLLLMDKLSNKCGLMIDECGQQYNSFKYGKEDIDVRTRLVCYNKFFRQFHGSGSLCIYLDQNEDNVNTALYRTVFYVIQTQGCRLIHTNIFGWLFFELYKLIFRKKSDNEKSDEWVNPFSLVSIEFCDYTKTGDYAKNYSINIDADKMFYYVDSVQNMYGHHDTNVFKKYNPAVEEEKPYIWGTDDKIDDKLMEQNFGLDDLKKSFNTNGIDISKVNKE